MSFKNAKWAFLISTTGLLVGSMSAGFLWLLDQVTNIRTVHPWLLLTMPLMGAGIVLMYAILNPMLGNGNAYIIKSFFKEPIEDKKPSIPLLLAPLVLIGTLLTHLGGGSAGREGTAVQMGASISNQFNRWFILNSTEKKLLTCIGISAGFAGVFGTPIAASIFAIEFFGSKKINWFFILPCLLSAVIANLVCLQWGILHAHYQIIPFFNLNFNTIRWIGLSGIIFGLASLLFVQSNKLFSKLLTTISSPYIRIMTGGIIIVALVHFSQSEKMSGLGLQTITDAFTQPQSATDFFIKIVLTSLTLSAGFKGGEVTPLFFIGAVLGSALVAFIPLPISLLAGLGLIAVFAGATHCLLSSIILGIELFGIEHGMHILLVCTIAYLFSGSNSIYEGRPIGKIKKAIAPYFL